MKISFWLAGSKLNGAGLAPLYAKISVKGKKPVTFSIGINIKPDQWVPGGYGLVVGPERWAASCNEKLLNIRAEIQGIYNDLERRRQVITPQIIKNVYTSAHLSSISLKSAMFRYIDERKKEELSAGTLKTMRIRCQNVVKYLIWKKCEERELIEITVSFLADLEAYLKTECEHSQSHINKILRFVKAEMDFGVRKEWLEHNPLLSYQVKKLPRKQKVYLSLKELEKIRRHRYVSWRLEKIAKLFLFQCYTGLAYAELMRFNKSWLRPGVDDPLWIFTDRQKVAGSSCQIPLFTPAAEILSENIRPVK